LKVGVEMELEKILMDAIFMYAKQGDVDAILYLKKFLKEGQAVLESLYYDGNKEHAVGTVVVREGVTSLDNKAFMNCDKLEKVILPDSLISIDDGDWWLIDEDVLFVKGTFYGCTSLTEINLPEGLTSIGDCAFYGCRSLTEIKLPDSLTSIGDHAFYGCKSLTQINLPEGLTSISIWAFSGCTSLTQIKLPEGLTSISNLAFSGCTRLTQIKLPEGLSSIGASAFYGCTSLTEIVLPDTLTSIGRSAFDGCTSLREINLPEGLTSIGDSAFSGCTRLTQIYIPDNDKFFIGLGCFNSCPDTTGVISSKFWDSVGVKTLADFRNLENLILPEGLSSIGDQAFDGCTALTQINLPEGLTSIGDLAFSGCTSLTQINLPEGLTYIDDYAFYGCTSLREINLPDSLTSIGKYAFSGCTRLTQIKLPEGLTSIGDSAFSGCTRLTQINLPEALTYIGWYAFEGCTSLTKINLPEALTYIGWHAFYGCTSLTKINLPEGLTYIGYAAFNGCTSLRKISYYKKTEDLLKRHFGDKWEKFEKVVIDEPAEIISPKIENEFVKFAKSRGIEFFVHFTRIENLHGIAEHGLLTRQNLDKMSVDYSYNDSQRLDNLTNSLSLSVTFPNYKMFYKYSQASSNWAVILLDAEKILSDFPCAFNYTNAANSDIKNKSKEERMTLDAFKGMFYEGVRTARQLSKNEPTDPQAEILCFSDIPTNYFKAVVFKNSWKADEYRQIFPNVPCNVDSDYFAPRHDWAYWKSNYYYEDEVFY